MGLTINVGIHDNNNTNTNITLNAEFDGEVSIYRRTPAFDMKCFRVMWL